MTQPQTETESMTYVGRNPCGCIGLLVVDNPDHARDVAKDIAAGIRRGLRFERVATEWVRSPACSLRPCENNPACVRTKRRKEGAAA